MSTALTYESVRSTCFVDDSIPKPNVQWLWHGYLARGRTTLLTSQWKAGKTTLLSVLLARMADGGELAGLPVARAKVAIVSEERLDSWRLRHELLHFGDNLQFFCRPFAGRPSSQAWRAFIEHLALLGLEEGVDLVVIDPLAPMLPGAAESNPMTIIDALQPLEELTKAGQSVLLLHHPRKGETKAGQPARGSGALCATVDVMIEMTVAPGNRPQDRRRRLLAWSRLQDTPGSRILELSADGTDYAEVTIEPGAGKNRRMLTVVEQLVTSPPRMLTRFQLLKHWPRREKSPHPKALWRALDAAVKAGELTHAGSGARNDPFRYGPPGVPARWNPDFDETLSAAGSNLEA